MKPQDLEEARRLLGRATELDPRFAQAFASLAFAQYMEVIVGVAAAPGESMRLAIDNARTATGLDDKDAMAHTTLGRIQVLMGDHDAGIAELERAIALNPSSALAHHGLGLAFSVTDQPERTIAACGEALRLSPHDPLQWAFHAVRAGSRIRLGDFEGAVEEARRGVRSPAAPFWPHAMLTAALALLDRPEEAAAARQNLLEIKPDFTPDAVLVAMSPLNPEALRPNFQSMLDGLRKAGLDDSPGA